MAAITRVTSRRRGCAGKIPHPDRATAERAITGLVARGCPPGSMHAYRCKRCSVRGRPAVWHIGHRPRGTWSR